MDQQNQYCENGCTTENNYRLIAIPIKIPMSFFIEIEKTNKRFIWKHKRPRIVKTTMSEKSNVGGIIMPDLKLYHRATEAKTAWR
jgi:hypothetical protein